MTFAWRTISFGVAFSAFGADLDLKEVHAQKRKSRGKQPYFDDAAGIDIGAEESCRYLPGPGSQPDGRFPTFTQD